MRVLTPWAHRVDFSSCLLCHLQGRALHTVVNTCWPVRKHGFCDPWHPPPRSGASHCRRGPLRQVQRQLFLLMTESPVCLCSYQGEVQYVCSTWHWTYYDNRFIWCTFDNFPSAVADRIQQANEVNVCYCTSKRPPWSAAVNLRVKMFSYCTGSEVDWLLTHGCKSDTCFNTCVSSVPHI